jgi:predicted aldo/keto reductase-like oxidoreductase
MTDFARETRLSADTPAVCRLGLATRGNGHLTATDVRAAIDAGVNYLNWCGQVDGMSQAIAELSPKQREQVVIAIQLEAREAVQATRELEAALRTLKTDTIDVVTFYYVESQAEWDEIAAKGGGARQVMLAARAAGKVRLLGMTTHQRDLAARIAQTGLLDLLMIRYNAAHRGAETEIFPITRARRMPVISFTAQRWDDLRKPTPEDPTGFTPPSALAWYRFALAQPDISVVLMAPEHGWELEQNLHILRDWRPPTESELQAMRDHGDRVHRHAQHFP